MKRMHAVLACLTISLTMSLSLPPRLAAQASSDTTALSDSAVAWQLGYQKKERTAFVLGLIVPGAGHLYAREWWKSYLVFVATSGGLAYGTLMYQWPRCGFDFFSATDCSVSPGARILGATMVTATLAEWAMSAADAGSAVDRGRTNRARAARLRRDALLPMIEPCGPNGRSWCVGVSIAAQ